MSEVQKKNAVKRRSKGEKTRRLILSAAIEVLAQQGIKGTTHRAVASHADIQLSLTTYYFKDIQELVFEAFLLCCEEKVKLTLSGWQTILDTLKDYDKTSLRKAPIKEELGEKLADVTARYLHQGISDNATYLKVEQLLFAEMQFNPLLARVGEDHRTAMLKPIEKFCHFLNKKFAQIDADMLLTQFNQIEYRYLNQTEQTLSLDEIRQYTQRIIGLLMRIKQ